jgi:hypothetical protein
MTVLKFKFNIFKRHQSDAGLKPVPDLGSISFQLVGNSAILYMY